MNNMIATWRYRNSIAAAVAEYRAQLRFLFKAHGEPIPLTPECAWSMTMAQDALFAAFKVAGDDLDWDRYVARRQEELA